MSDISKQLPAREEGKLNVYMHISENSGVGYYRQYLPAIKLREKGLANVLISDFRWGEGDHQEPDIEKLFQLINWADIVIVGRKDTKEFYAQWGGIKEFFNIPIIMDTDDNVQHVRPYNPGYQGYHPGSEALVWNKYGIAKTFSAITVTTQDLLDFHKKDNPKIFILPNMLDMDIWNSLEKKKWNDEKVRIGFIASGAHWEGVPIIRDAMIAIMEKYPQVEFYITHLYKSGFDGASQSVKDRIIPIPWIKLQDWAKGVMDLGLDIGLAPLPDNMFNRAKSNLRWMEYSAAKMATVASPVKPYLCIKNEEDGFLAKENMDWFNILDKLVANPELVYNIGEKAHQRVCEEFDINKHIGLWAKTYQEVQEKYKDFFGKKKKFLLTKEGKGNKKNQYKEILRGESLFS